MVALFLSVGIMPEPNYHVSIQRREIGFLAVGERSWNTLGKNTVQGRGSLNISVNRIVYGPAMVRLRPTPNSLFGAALLKISAPAEWRYHSYSKEWPCLNPKHH